MDRRSIVAVFMAFVAGVAVTVSFVAPQRAHAGGAGKGTAQTYIYYPAVGSNPAELLDTRNGAIYKRSSSSTNWDVHVKALDQE